MQESRTQLKTYFQTGDTPTQDQFENLIDSTLNITDDGNPRPYSVYVGVFTQTGVSAPSVTALENTISNDLVWTRVAVGRYQLSAPNAFVGTVHIGGFGDMGGAFNPAMHIVRPEGVVQPTYYSIARIDDSTIEVYFMANSFQYIEAEDALNGGRLYLPEIRLYR